MRSIPNWKFVLPAGAVLALSVAAILIFRLFFAAPPQMALTLKEELFLPALNGPFKVGETTAYMVDKNRPALPDLAERREWVATIYYPAKPEANAIQGPSAEITLNKAYTELMLAKASADALDHIHANAYWQAAADHTADKYPVLLFSPGGGEQPLFYSSLLEQISSFGYIVVAVPEPFDTPVIPLPDGRMLTKAQMETWCKQNDTCQKALKGDTAATEEITNAMKDDRAKDMMFSLSELEKVNREDPILAGILDLDKIGAFVHSFGGASSVRIGQLDDRVGAVAVLDSDIFYVIDQNSKPLAQPVLYMTSTNIDESPEGLAAIEKSDYLADRYFRTGSAYYLVNIAGTTHQSFQSDAMFLAPYITISGQKPTLYASSTTPDRITQVITNYVLAFFDQHLKGIAQPLLVGPASAYPEVTFTSKK